MENNFETGVGFVAGPQFTQAYPMVNCVTSAPGLEIATASHLTVENANTFFVRQGSSSSQMAISYVAASTVFPALTGPHLAFDNGTVPEPTNSCRCYTFFATVSPTAPGTVTITVGYGQDFPKTRPAYASDFYLGDGTKAIIGYLYVKNESSAAFVPGTTALNTSGITATPSDQFGYSPATCT